MQSAPIQQGARRPGDRPRHALVLVLARVIAVAGFAVAGWVALAALTGSASADEPPARVDGAASLPTAVPASGGLPVDAGLSGAVTAVPDGLRDAGSGVGDAGALRPAAGWRPDVAALTNPVREVGHDPVRYLQTRGQDLVDRKDLAVRHVRGLADAAGVPNPRIADVPEDAPLVQGLVPDAPETQPVLADAQPPAEAAEPQDADAETDRGARASGDAAAPAHQCAPHGCTAAHTPHKHCADCFDDPADPAPALPSGQDNPRSGGSGGGHTFTPVADLQSARYPAAPLAAGHGTFHRTALTDVSAPGGPAVVPD